MTKCAPLWRLLLSLFLASFLAGCSQFKRADLADEKDPHYLDAKRRQAMKDTSGAIQSFERALQSNPNNAAAHFELGLIYETRSNELAASIYHFQKFLTLRTNASQAGIIQQKIKDVKRTLATQEAPINFNRSVEAQVEKLLVANQNYAKRIEQLEAELERPRYITNYVTNWYATDPEEQRSRSMARPARQVDPPPVAKAAESSNVEEEEPASNPRTEQKAPRNNPATDTKAATGSSSSNRGTPAGNTSGRTERNGSPSAGQSKAQRERAEPQPSASRARGVHTVRPGDTLARVAQQYGVTVAELRKANPQAAKGAVAGQKLVIPQK